MQKARLAMTWMPEDGSDPEEIANPLYIQDAPIDTDEMCAITRDVNFRVFSRNAQIAG